MIVTPSEAPCSVPNPGDQGSLVAALKAGDNAAFEELMRVAYDWSRDISPPKSRLLPGEGSYSGPVEMEFVTPSEPAIVYYTLDGSRPDFDSLRLVSEGPRQGAAPITISETTTVNWFSVDMAGNVEQGYDPSNPSSSNYRSERIVIE